MGGMWSATKIASSDIDIIMKVQNDAHTVHCKGFGLFLTHQYSYTMDNERTMFIIMWCKIT